MCFDRSRAPPNAGRPLPAMPRVRVHRAPCTPSALSYPQRPPSTTRPIEVFVTGTVPARLSADDARRHPPLLLEAIPRRASCLRRPRRCDPTCYTRRVSTTRSAPAPTCSGETPEERALARKLVRQWQEARAIATKHGLDVDGVLNVIRGLDLSPAERIELGLRAARLGNAAERR